MLAQCVGLNDLKALLPPKQFYDSVNSSSCSACAAQFFAVLAWVCSLTFLAPTPVMLILKWPPSLVFNLLSSLSLYLQIPRVGFFYRLFCFVVFWLVWFWFGVWFDVFGLVFFLVWCLLLFKNLFELMFFSPLYSFWIFPGVEESFLLSQKHFNATIIEATFWLNIIVFMKEMLRKRALEQGQQNPLGKRE